jgi:hypothetical protein
MSKKDSPLVRGMVSFIGIDYTLLKRSGEDNISKFYLSGFLVLLIALVSFLSVFYGFDLMFHRWYAEFLLSTFFSLTFLTIYLLLIQTFSKETFPSGNRWLFFNTSNITRICFVLLISFLIAQPVKIFLIRESLDREIAVYKINLNEAFARKNAQLYQKDLEKLKRQRSRYKNPNGDLAIGQYLARSEEQISDIYQRIALDNQDAAIKINGSDFFLKRIERANKYPKAWLATLFVIALFGLPVYLIYSISDNSSYYLEKKRNDRWLVLEDYARFKTRYHLLFKSKYGKDIYYHEPFLDPPFNKRRKAEPQYGTGADFYQKHIG